MSKADSRPTSVRVGPTTFKIVYSERSFLKYATIAEEIGADVNRLVIGKTFFRQAVIVVRSEKIPSLTVQKETLLHEILHAINVVMGWPYSFTFDKSEDDLEEALVSLAAPLLFSVLRDNPKVLAWMTN